MKAFSTVAILLFIAQSRLLTAQGIQRYQQVILADSAITRLTSLRSFDPHLILPGPDGNGLRTILSEQDVQLLQAKGFLTRIEIEDMASDHAARAAADINAGGLSLAKSIADETDVPEHFSLGSFYGFYTLEEAESELRRMTELFPNLVQGPYSIGTSVEGRDISAVKISAAASGNDIRETLYTGLHHAREPMSMMSLYFVMWHLLEGYGADPEITSLLDSRALWFIPMVNPDGYEYNLNVFPEGGGYWRKNRGGIGGQGVDLNRNYSTEAVWGEAHTPGDDDPRSGNYRGSKPFSEPESRAIADFVAEHRFGTAFNLHSLSNVLIYMSRTPVEDVADSAWYVEAAMELAKESGYGQGKGEEAIGYEAYGTAEAWMFDQTRTPSRVFAWTPEIGSVEDTFWPVPSRIPELAAAITPMLIRGAWMAGSLPRVTAWRRIGNGDFTEIAVTITNIGIEPMSGPADVFMEFDPSSSTSISALRPGQSVELRFPVTDSIRKLPVPREDLSVRIADHDGIMRAQKIRPMIHSSKVLFEDSFEGTLGLWDNDLWGIETASGQGRVLSTSPYEPDFRSDSPNVIELKSPVSLAGLDAAELQFDASVLVRGVHDRLEIEARSSSTSDWRPVDGEYMQNSMQMEAPEKNQFRGVYPTWRTYRIPLDDYAGEDVLLRFSMYTLLEAAFMRPLDGVQIDNLRIVGTTRPPSGTDSPSAEADRGISVWPNPAGSTLHVRSGSLSEAMTVRLFDMLGREVLSGQGTGSVTLQVGSLPPGAYVLRIADGESMTIRSIIRR